MLSMSSIIVSDDLWDGIASLYAMRIKKGALMAGRPLKEVRLRPDVNLIVYVERQSKEGFIPRGNTILAEGDLCYVISLKKMPIYSSVCLA